MLNEARARIDAALRQANADLAPLSRSLTYWGAAESLIRERQLLQLMNDSELLEEAYDEVFHHLPQLPRNAKRIINRLRVLLFVAHARGLFAGDRAITPRHIGKWVALQEQWPELAQAVLLEPSCVARLEQAAEDAARFVTLAAELLPGAPADEKLRAFCGSREVCLAAAAERITYLT